MSQTSEPQDPVGYVQDILLHALDDAEQLGRADIVERLGSSRDSLAERNATLALLVGLSDAGKSSLLNAVAGWPVVPIDVIHPTPVSVLVGAGDERIVAYRSDGTDHVAHELAGFEELANLMRADPASVADVTAVAVASNRWGCHPTLTVLDSPSWSLSSAATRARVMGFSPDLLVLVADGGQELSHAELAVLHAADRWGTQAVIVLTKIDLHPHWRRIVSVDEQHLVNARLRAPIYPVSVRLAELAARTGDRQLLTESGLPDFVEVLDRLATGQRVLRAAERALDLVDRATTELAASVEEQLALVTDPDRAVLEEARRAEARTRAARLTGPSARWRDRLYEGLERRGIEARHALDTGLSRVQTRAAEEIDTADPAVIWPAFAPWLQTEVESEVGHVFELLQDGTTALVRDVAKLFGEEGGEPGLAVDVANRRHVPEDVRVRQHLDDIHRDRGSTIINTLRGSAASVSITAVVRTLAVGFGGATLSVVLLPVGAAMTILLGHRAYKASRESEVLARRRAAGASVHKYLDDVRREAQHQLNNESLSLRRAVPEHFMQLATVRIQEIDAAMRASALSDSDRAKAEQQLRARMAHIEFVAGHARLARARLQPQLVVVR